MLVDSEPSLDTTEMEEEEDETMSSNISSSDLDSVDDIQNNVVIISQENQQPFLLQSVDSLNEQNVEQYIQPTYVSQTFMNQDQYGHHSFVKQECMQPVQVEVIFFLIYIENKFLCNALDQCDNYYYFFVKIRTFYWRTRLFLKVKNFKLILWLSQQKHSCLKFGQRI